MTRTLIRFTGWLLPLCALWAGIALWLGPRLPPPPSGLERYGFAACELPCWAGITPGETPFDQVAPLLQQNLDDLQSDPALSFSMVRFGIPGPTQHVSGTVAYDRRKAGNIRLNITMSLESLLWAMGRPHCVWVNDALHSLVVHWDVAGRNVHTVISSDTRGVFTRHTQAHDLIITTNTAACEQTTAVEWLGFAPFWRYMERETS